MISRKYTELSSIIKAPESINLNWQLLQPYIPDRWSKLYLLSDATLGAFTSIANSRAVGHNQIFISDRSKVFIYILDIIKSKKYEELINIIKTLSVIDKNRLAKILKGNKITNEDINIGIAACLLVGSALSNDHFKINSNIINSLPIKYSIDQEIRIKELINNILILHDVFSSSTIIENICALDFITRESKSICSDDFIFFDPGGFEVQRYRDNFKTRIKNDTIYYNGYSKLHIIKSIIQKIIRRDCKYCLLVRFTKEILKPILDLSPNYEVFIDYLEMNTYSTFKYDEKTSHAERQYGRILRPTEYVVIYNSNKEKINIGLKERNKIFSKAFIGKYTECFDV